jgi:hypothetical protein
LGSFLALLGVGRTQFIDLGLEFEQLEVLLFQSFG